MAVLPTRLLEIEFDAGVWTDVSADFVEVGTRRGRNRELGAFETGTMVFTLRNEDRRYDPDHTGGPHYGKLRPNRRVRFRATWNAVTHPVFVGYIDSIDQIAGGPHDGSAAFAVSDLFKLLNRADLPSSVYVAEVAAAEPDFWWPMNDPADATSTVDIVGGLVADRIGTGTFGGPPLAVRDPGGAYQGDGAWPSGLELRNGQAVPIAGSAGFTVEFLYQGTAGNYFYHQGAGGQFFNLYFQSTGRLTLEYFDSTGALPLAVIGSANLNDGATHHVAMVYDLTDLRFYIDGVYDSAATVAANTAGLTFTGGIGTAYIWTGGFASGTSLNGVGDEFAIYRRPLSPAEVAAHNDAARTPWRGDLPGDRLERIFDLAAVPAADRDIDAGTTTLQSTDLGGDALSYAQRVEETELGSLFVARDGKLAFVGRHTLQTGDYLTSQATLVDADSGAGLPYRSGDSDVNEQTIVTRATVSRLDSIAVTVHDEAARLEFGWLDETHEGLLHDDDAYSKHYAEWIVNTHKEPTSRVGAVTLELTGDPTALYPAILALEIGDRVTYKRTPQGVGTTIDLAMRVEAISHETGGGYWRTTLQLSPFNLAGGLPVFIWGVTKWGEHVWGI